MGFQLLFFLQIACEQTVEAPTDNSKILTIFHRVINWTCKLPANISLKYLHTPALLLVLKVMLYQVYFFIESLYSFIEYGTLNIL